ncbi:major facilitator superfamily domain-containing protein [Crassisporium funariophilum]|nr:major facilitator superfamily domain-containing protein [Crassisporium funariophilum]
MSIHGAYVQPLCYYQETALSASSPSRIAWIGSIQHRLVLLPGIMVGRLFDIGYFKSTLMTASAIVVGATVLVAECTEYWQFLLCQGIATVGKRRGLAMGFVAVGASFGGTVLPFAGKFKWTMRIFGLILFAALGVSNILLKRRLPPRQVADGLFNLHTFKSAPYPIYCVSAFIKFLRIYTRIAPDESHSVFVYIDVSSTAFGISANFSFNYIALASASSHFGRLVFGILCDVLGAMNGMIPFTAVTAIVTLCVTKSALIAVSVIYGFCLAPYVSLMWNPLMEMGDTHDVGDIWECS